MLTLNQQRELMKNLTKAQKMKIKRHCRACDQKGQGILDIVKSLGKKLIKILGPVAKELKPVIIKEIIVPLIRKKMSGRGLSPAGAGLKLAGQGMQCGIRSAASSKGKGAAPPRGSLHVKGKGLKLAGQGKKPNPWMIHVKSVKAKNPGMQFKDVLKLASKSYKK